MAAPINAYRNKSLWMRDGGVNYEHNTAILQVNKATMLDRFYLDEIMPANDGVIGLVIIGGQNEQMHNIDTRGGVGRVRVNGQTARLLNDAGLNTLGKVLSFNPPTDMDRDNRTIDDVEFKTAYYLSGLVGIRYYQPEYGTTEMEISDYISQNNTFTRSYYLPGVYTRNPVVVYAFVQNDEGEYRTPAVYIDIEQYFLMMSYNPSSSFLLCGMVRTNQIYPDTLEIGIGTQFYTDVNLTIKANTGGYSDGQFYYTFINTTGVTEIVDCADAPMRTPFDYVTRAEDPLVACALAGEEDYTIYFQDIGGDRYFYKYQSGANGELADEGYYSYIDAPLGIPLRKVLHVNEFGRMTFDVYCNDL